MVNPVAACRDAGGRVTGGAGQKTCIQFQRSVGPPPAGETAAGTTGTQAARNRLCLEKPSLQGFFAVHPRGMRPQGRTCILSLHPRGCLLRLRPLPIIRIISPLP